MVNAEPNMTRKGTFMSNFEYNSWLQTLKPFPIVKNEDLKDKLKQQGINEVLMIRALLRYFFNVYSVTSRVEDGENIDDF